MLTHQAQNSKATDFTRQRQHAANRAPARIAQHTHPAAIIQRARATGSLTAADVLHLQQTIGNEAVGRLMSEMGMRRNQPKLTINPPGDVYEQEADKVAEKVVSSTNQSVSSNREQPVQRQEMPEEEEEELMTKQVAQSQKTGEVRTAAPDMESSLQGMRGGGQPLSESVRSFFEPRFGYDFSRRKKNQALRRNVQRVQRQMEGEKKTEAKKPAEAAAPKRELSRWERLKVWAFEKALSLAGVNKEMVMGLIENAGSLFMEIIKHPVRFVNTLISALWQGFKQFVANVSKYLKGALMGWIFGNIARAGIELPRDFSLKSILTMVLQILGVTAEQIRQKLVKLIGEKNVSRLERTWKFLSELIGGGISGAANALKRYLGGIKAMVVGAIKAWVTKHIVQAGVLKVLSMFNPVTGLIAIIKSLYNIIQFLVQKASQIAALFGAIAGSVVPLAKGIPKEAADKIEQMLGNSIALALGFLAGFLGIGNIASAVKGVITRFQGMVEKAIDKVVNFVVRKVKKWLGKDKRREQFEKAGKTKEEETLASKEVKAKVKAELSGKSIKDANEADALLINVYNKYKPEGLKGIKLVRGPERLNIIDVLVSASLVTKVETLNIKEPDELEQLMNIAIDMNPFSPRTSLYIFYGDDSKQWDGPISNTPNNSHAEVNAKNKMKRENFIQMINQQRKDGKRVPVIWELNRTPCNKCILIIESVRKWLYDNLSDLEVKAVAIYQGSKKFGEIVKKTDLEELLKTGAKISVLEIWGLIAKKLSDAGVKEIRYRDYYKPIEEVLEIAGGAFIEQEKLKKGIEKALKVIENMPKIDGKKIGDI